MDQYTGQGPAGPDNRSGDDGVPGVEPGAQTPQQQPSWPAGPTWPGTGYGTTPPRMRPPKRRIWPTFVSALVGALVGALLVFLLLPWGFGVSPIDIINGKVRKAQSQQQQIGNTAKQVKGASPTSGAIDVSGIARKVMPSIVNINVAIGSGQSATGSGVIYTTDGYILTNNHVAGDADTILVNLVSGEEVKGKLVGADPENDIAVVKIDKGGLPAMIIGDSDNLVVGELAVAVGSPFGFEQSVTSGIISALHRTVSGGAEPGTSSIVLTDLIQTDAAINPGNSGGALCNSAAQLIGLNTVIATQSGGSEGVGFAIPSSTARRVADDIIAGRPVSHPYIGIAGQSISQNIARQYNLPVEKGAYVTNVAQGSPADRAGIKRGDIVTAADGKPLDGMDELVALVRSRNVGDSISVTFYSGGKDRKTATLKLEEKPEDLTQ